MRRTGQTPYYSEYYQNIFKRNWIKIFHFLQDGRLRRGLRHRQHWQGICCTFSEELLIFFSKLI